MWTGWGGAKGWALQPWWRIHSSDSFPWYVAGGKGCRLCCHINPFRGLFWKELRSGVVQIMSQCISMNRFFFIFGLAAFPVTQQYTSIWTILTNGERNLISNTANTCINDLLPEFLLWETYLIFYLIIISFIHPQKLSLTELCFTTDPRGTVHSEITNKNGNPNYKYFYSNAEQGDHQRRRCLKEIWE